MESQAAEYIGVYKCRLCGETFTEGHTGMALARATVLGLCSNPKSTAFPSMRNIHYCQNGGFGMADFQGWKKGDE